MQTTGKRTSAVYNPEQCSVCKCIPTGKALYHIVSLWIQYDAGSEEIAGEMCSALPETNEQNQAYVIQLFLTTTGTVQNSIFCMNSTLHRYKDGNYEFPDLQFGSVALSTCSP